MKVTTITPCEVRAFAALVETWANAEHDRKRLGFGWQRADAHRWWRLAYRAVMASSKATPGEMRRQAREIVRESRDPKIKGPLRRGFRALAGALFSAARWPGVT